MLYLKNSLIVLEKYCSYSYYVNQKYISIIIRASSWRQCASGGSFAFTYIYDINNDKVISNQEILNLYNVTQQDIEEKIRVSMSGYSDIESLVESAKNDYEVYIDSEENLVIVAQFGPAIGTIEFVFDNISN